MAKTEDETYLQKLDTIEAQSVGCSGNLKGSPESRLTDRLALVMC